jgi:hypothetical protein
MLLGLSAFPAGGQAGTLDQSVVLDTGLAVIASGLAQTFTPGLTGNLDQVDVLLYRKGNPGDAVVQIRNVSAGRPTGPALATGAISESGIGTDPFPKIFNSVPLSRVVPVKAGEHYAIVLLAPGSSISTDDYIGWISDYNPYPPGEAFYSEDGGATWLRWPVEVCGAFAGPGCFDSAFKTYVVANQAPDCSHVSATPGTLWPPNGKLTPVTLSGATDPDGDAVTITITGVTQDEPPGREGDATLGPGGNRANLRARRNGGGNGRVYRIGFVANDGEGGSCTGTASVGVPHDRASQPIASPKAYNSLRR